MIINQDSTHRLTSKGERLSFVFACIYCISILIFNIGNPMLPHAFFSIWIAVTIVGCGKRLKIILSQKYFIYFYCFIFYYFFASLFAFNFVTCVNRVITMFELVSPFIMFELYSNIGKKLSSGFLIIFTATLVFDICIMYSTISLSNGLGLKQHIGDDDFLDKAFNLVYGISLLPGFLLYQIRRVIVGNYINKAKIILSLLALIAIIVTIVTLSMYATALFIMIFSITLGYFYMKNRWKIKMLLTLGILLVFFTYLFPAILSLISDIIPDSKILLIRFEEVFNFLTGNVDSESSSSARSARALMSFRTFLEYPLFGITHLTSNFENLEGVKLGNHTEWIDDLALYGIFSVFLYAFLWKGTKRLNKQINIVVLILPFLILGFFNQCFYLIQMFTIFLYAPRIGKFIDSNKIK